MAFWSGLFGKRESKPSIETPPVTLANLRLQVFREDYVGIAVLDRENAAVRRLAPGLVEVIVEAIAGGERTLRWEYLRPFGKTDDELFDLARVQAAASGGEVKSEVLDGIQVMASNGFYMSAQLLDTFRESKLAKGVLVSPVSWHHWCVHIIGALTVTPHLQMMRFLAQSIAAQMTVTDAERLTTDVYWVKPGGRAIERVEMIRDEPVLSRELAAVLELTAP